MSGSVTPGDSYVSPDSFFSSRPALEDDPLLPYRGMMASDFGGNSPFPGSSGGSMYSSRSSKKRPDDCSLCCGPRCCCCCLYSLPAKIVAACLSVTLLAAIGVTVGLLWPQISTAWDSSYLKKQVIRPPYTAPGPVTQTVMYFTSAWSYVVTPTSRPSSNAAIPTATTTASHSISLAKPTGTGTASGSLGTATGTKTGTALSSGSAKGTGTATNTLSGTGKTTGTATKGSGKAGKTTTGTITGTLTTKSGSGSALETAPANDILAPTESLTPSETLSPSETLGDGETTETPAPTGTTSSSGKLESATKTAHTSTDTWTLDYLTGEPTVRLKTPLASRSIYSKVAPIMMTGTSTRANLYTGTVTGSVRKSATATATESDVLPTQGVARKLESAQRNHAAVNGPQVSKDPDIEIEVVFGDESALFDYPH